MSLKKIAEELGLSLTTVSRTLNGYPEPPTAVLVDNRLARAGSVHAALQAGYVLGQDMSLIVYDGLGTDSVICQAITSIDQPAPGLVGVVLARIAAGPPAR